MTTHVDPVCGMPVTRENGVLLEDETNRLWFCSEFCRQQYLRHPRAYEVGAVRLPQTVHWATRRVAYFSMELALANDIPTYAVSIAVEYDGQTVAGVVVDAPKGEVFTATKGGGAFADGKPIQVSGCTDLSTALVGTGFGYDPVRRQVQAEVIQHLITKVRDIRRIGVGAIDLCYVACGRLDAVYERGLNPWDYGAGALIAAEAGATIGGLHGAPVSPEMSIATSPALLEPFHDLLAAANPLRN